MSGISIFSLFTFCDRIKRTPAWICLHYSVAPLVLAETFDSFIESITFGGLEDWTMDCLRGNHCTVLTIFAFSATDGPTIEMSPCPPVKRKRWSWPSCLWSSSSFSSVATFYLSSSTSWNCSTSGTNPARTVKSRFNVLLFPAVTNRWRRSPISWSPWTPRRTFSSTRSSGRNSNANCANLCGLGAVVAAVVRVVREPADPIITSTFAPNPPQTRWGLDYCAAVEGVITRTVS